MITTSPISLSLSYRAENKRFSTLKRTKTGGIQPKLNAACFVQSCLTDADFVLFSNYCLIGTRLYGASCFSIFSADLSGARPRRSDRRYRAFAPWAPLLSVSIPSILCTGVGENVSRHFLQSLLDKSLVRLSRFRTFFLSGCCPVSVRFLSSFA